MNLKFFSNYDHSENLLKRFKSNYIIDDDQLSFVTNNEYDVAVVFNGSNEWIKPSATIITVIQEPSWSPLPQRDFLINSDYLVVHDPELFERTHQIKLKGKVIESPSYLFYDDKVDRRFFNDSTLVVKEKKISMIVSALHYNIGNYGKRLNLLGKILESDLPIDIYGRGWNIPDLRYKGGLEFKYNGLLPYEYSIAIENSNEKNYITEKFVDCVICNTIPIYNGAPNINEVYDSRYFKTIDLDSPSIIDDLKSIIALPAPVSTVNKEIYFKSYNLYTKLKDILLK